MHVEGQGQKTRMGPNGKPLPNNPPLSPQQQKVVDKNIKDIRKSGNKIGKHLQHEEKVNGKIGDCK